MMFWEWETVGSRWLERRGRNRVTIRLTCRSGIVIITGLLFGATFLKGQAAGNERSAIEAFCVSCHEMNDYVPPEYERSTYYRAGGARASCVDCHVPREFPGKALKHLSATPMLYHHYPGRIGTWRDFENKRQLLAERVWAEMRANNGRECRNFHAFQSIRITPQNAEVVMWHCRSSAKGEPAHGRLRTSVPQRPRRSRLRRNPPRPGHQGPRGAHRNRADRRQDGPSRQRA